PQSASLTVEERFQAIAVDPLLPTFVQANYLRPLAPRPGALGAAVVVVEQVVISDGCSTQPLVRRETAIFSRARGGLAFSVARGEKAWSVSGPYALNPANSYSDAPVFTPASAAPASLLALAARSDLASLLGTGTSLAGTVTAAPLAGPAQWGGGVLLSEP